jgi:hypothetical protein
LAEIFDLTPTGTTRPANVHHALASPAFNEIGTTGLRTSGGQILEEFVPRLSWPRAGSIYQEMSSNDPVITAILLCSRQLIRNVSWDVVPASKDTADIEAAEFLRECMEDMSTTWSDFIDDVFSFFEYGFSYHEIVYKKREGASNNPQRNSKFSDGRIGWRKIPGRAQTSMQGWNINDVDGELYGMRQWTLKGSVEIPLSRSLLFRTTAARGNPEGRSFLRGAYRPWYFKKHFEEIEGIGVERDLAGLPVVKAAPGIDIFDKDNPKAVEAKTQALNLVSSIRRDRNEGVVLPDGWELKLLASGSSRQFDTNEIINRLDQRIAITMLADIVMLGADKVGSFALAKVKQSMLAACLQAQLNSVCDILNTIAVPRLFALNTFNVTKLPRFKTSPVVSPDLKELGDYIRALSGAKMPVFPDIDMENYLRKVANLPTITEDSPYREEQLKRSANSGASQQDPQNSNGDSTDPTQNDPQSPSKQKNSAATPPAKSSTKKGGR